jgi:hypothetical protein
MQYLLLIYDAESSYKDMPEAELAGFLGEYRAFTESIASSGQLLGSNRLHGARAATTVRLREGKAQITDGPFAETREALGGYYLVEAKDLDEAVKLAARIPSARYGSVEIRPVMAM